MQFEYFFFISPTAALWKHIRLFCDSTSNKPTTCFALLDVSWRGQIYKNNTILQIIIEIVKNYSSSSIHWLHARCLKLSRYRMLLFYPRCWFVISTNHTHITLFQNWNYNITLASKLEYIKGVEQNWQHCT